VKRPPTRPAVSPLRRLRPWLGPLLCAGLYFLLREPALDGDALRAALGDGRVEEALERLADAPAEALDPRLVGIDWWPLQARSERLLELDLEAQSGSEPTAGPVIVEPLAAWRAAPRRVRLAEPAGTGWRLAIDNLELGLPVADLAWPQGAQEVALDLAFIPGTTCVLRLSDADGGPLALGAFQLLPVAVAEQQGLQLAAAHALGGGGSGGELLAGLVALHLGLHAEAEQRFRQLLELPGYERVARELSALALEAQGLDRAALLRLGG